MTDENPYSMNIRSAAKILEVHENTVRAWIAKGLLDAWVMPSGFKRLKPGDVELLAIANAAWHRHVPKRGRKPTPSDTKSIKGE